MEKPESLARQKERNRVVEYLILLSAELTNSVGVSGHATQRMPAQQFMRTPA